MAPLRKYATFEPDFTHIVDAASNRQARRLPLYEHIIAPEKMEEILGLPFADLLQGDRRDQGEFFHYFCGFFKSMGYDTVSFEGCVVDVVSQGKALMGSQLGPVASREDFDRFPFDELPDRFFALHDSHFQALAEHMPPGMKAIGGIGNGVFEVTEDLVGYERLCLMKAMDPELYVDIFKKVGDVLVAIWSRFLERHGATYAVCRFGDDLGFKTSTLLPPDDIRALVLPHYKRIVELVHAHGKPFLLHSCGKIFDIMPDLIENVGIDAKHSNEDQIAPFTQWVDHYGARIGNFGGVDMNVLCVESEAEIRRYVTDVIERSVNHGGFAVGSGNSIPGYVPTAGYLAMVEAVRSWRNG